MATRWEPLASRRTAACFVLVGLTSTAIYVGLFAALSALMPGTIANLTALLATTAANTAAHRRLTFGVIGRSRRVRAQVGGFIALGISIGLSTAALAGLELFDDSPSTLIASIVLLVAAAIGSWLRFGPFRHWIGAAAMRKREDRRVAVLGGYPIGDPHPVPSHKDAV